MTKKIKKRLFLVKREVMAIDIKDAIKKSGVIYEIQLAADNLQPLPTKNPIGFNG